MFKRTLAALAASFMLATSAQATVPATRADLIDLLDSIGIDLVHGKCNNMYGSYNSGTNQLCVNSDLFVEGNEELFEQTLVHEAVHTAQDCLAGLHNNDMKLLLTRAQEVGIDREEFRKFVIENLPQVYYATIQEMDNPYVRDLEIEAYSFEDEIDFVYDLVRKSCANN